MRETYEGVILAMKRGRERAERAARLAALFPELNWRSHLHVLNAGLAGRGRGAEEVLVAASRYLAEQKLCTLYIHPFLKISMGGAERTGAEIWELLAGFTRPFQVEAYDQQSEARLFLLPIIEPADNTTLQAALSAAEFFSTRLAKPSIYLRGRPVPDPEIIAGTEMRIYADAVAGSGLSGTVEQICINQIFDDVLERIDEQRTDILAPCRKRLIIDETRGKVYACFAEWLRDRSYGGLETASELASREDDPRDLEHCSTCISRSCAAMERNLRANGKVEEGSRLFLKLAMALSSAGEHRPAEVHAQRAFEMAGSDEQRAAALLHQGLCNLSLMRLQQAEEALTAGQRYSSDQGLFAYHRGRVQFAWRDYIEAIDRFEEALASTSSGVPEADLLFNLALSHISIEEYKEARGYLDRMEQAAPPRPHSRMYQGVCDLYERKYEQALEKLQEALDLGPGAEDRGRVLFFIGNCLQELGRFDEAIARLRQAVETDPLDKANHNLLGYCYYKTERHEEAVDCFRKAIEIDPGSAMDYANLGSNLRDLGRYEEALAMYHKALTLDPTIDFARENMEKLEKRLQSDS
jgi:tetratricopeptide (TPR) repeat protein